MAYAAASAIVSRIISGKRQYRVTITETGAGAADEWSVELPGSSGTIVGIAATITAGTGAGTATLQPTLGRSTGWSTTSQDHVGNQDLPVVHVQDQTRLRYDLGAGHTLYGVSQCSDPTADHTILTELWIVEGWHA